MSPIPIETLNEAELLALKARLPPSHLLATEEDVQNLVEEGMLFLALSQEDYEAWIKKNVLGLAVQP